MATTDPIHVPTVDEMMERCRVHPAQLDGTCYFDMEGGRILTDAFSMRRVFEAAYDPTMPDWPSTITEDDLHVPAGC